MRDKEEILFRYKGLHDTLNDMSGKWGGVKILPVTKTVDAERILYLKEAGVEQIGENRVQEAMEKLDALNGAFDIHIIGRMQTNKAKYASRFASVIQSIDRIELCEALERALDKAGRTMKALIEVNIGNDPNKAGISEEETSDFVRKMKAYPHLIVKGLMTVAPIVQDAEEVRPYFQRMRRLFDGIRQESGGENMDTLSMGMSNDCFIAAQEGATIVRIGSAIFGRRQ
ncbi:MAG: YggS family pyridoxal phosphate-dependent enzyme [Clostridia bacterium]|nr:YggS family pyridoxal phosphate-dependent enzyme [Clostridia bacterium]